MAQEQLVESVLTRSIIGAFFEVYNTLGFGFLERLYGMALERELLARGHRVSRQVGVCIMYKGEELGTQRLDLIVDDKVVVETKSTYELHKAAHRQVYNYLKATRLEVGLLLHFGPEPKFYRLISTNKVNPPDPLNPDDPSEA
jgi:GxxExxY protein